MFAQFIAVLAVVLIPVLAWSRELPQADYPELPAQAASATAFAPSGWRVEFNSLGDLNGDKLADLVMVMRETNPANEIKTGVAKLDTNPRILAVAFGRSSGNYVLAMANHSLIPRATDPNLADYLENGSVSIKRGTLRVTLHLFARAGGWSAGNIAYTFRFQNGHFELIGYDSNTVQRNTGATEAISINYSTRKMKISTGSIDRDEVKDHWQSLAPRPLLRIGQIGNGVEFNPIRPATLSSKNAMSIVPDTQASRTPAAWNIFVKHALKISATQNGGKPHIGRSCQPKLKVCNTGIWFKHDGHQILVRGTTNLKGNIVQRAVCKYNSFMDLRHCLNWDMGRWHTDMKDAKGDWHQVSDR